MLAARFHVLFHDSERIWLSYSRFQLFKMSAEESKTARAKRTLEMGQGSQMEPHITHTHKKLIVERNWEIQ
jgi:hypothetical protein